METRNDTIAALKAQIADIERRPVLGTPARLAEPVGKGDLATPPGLLHEIFSNDNRAAGSALGFALGLAREFLTPRRPALFYLQLNRDAQELGLPYGPGLVHFGIDPACLTFVRARDITDLLWAAEEILSCRAVAAVIAEIDGHPKTLDFTASRRLALRAAASGTTLLMMRYGTWREASAAHYRWHLTPATSPPPLFDSRSPGTPRWQARLEKGVLANFDPHQDWLLELTKNGFAIDIGDKRPDRLAVRTTLSRAFPAHLAHGLSQTA